MPRAERGVGLPHFTGRSDLRLLGAFGEGGAAGDNGRDDGLQGVQCESSNKMMLGESPNEAFIMSFFVGDGENGWQTLIKVIDKSCGPSLSSDASWLSSLSVEADARAPRSSVATPCGVGVDGSESSPGKPSPGATGGMSPVAPSVIASVPAIDVPKVALPVSPSAVDAPIVIFFEAPIAPLAVPPRPMEELIVAFAVPAKAIDPPIVALPVPPSVMHVPPMSCSSMEPHEPSRSQAN